MGEIKLSAVIITYNEEDNIGRCLDSLNGIVDEVVVVDSFSNDKTKEICLSRNVNFIEHPFEGHIQQKNFAIKQAKNDHILYLDADEYLSEDLNKSISEIKKSWDADGYKLKRLSSLSGHWIKHSGWYPDSRIRVWDRTKGEWGGENPHDIVVMKKEAHVKRIKGNLMHKPFSSFNTFLKRQMNYAEISAQEAFNKNKKVSILDVVFQPFFTFVTRYFYKKGFLDGYRGFVICSVYGFVKFVKCCRIREMHKKSVK